MDGTHEASNSNSKKRVRASQACVYCRKKKIKCDETRPYCKACIELDVQCQYTEPKKRGPRKGYVQLLEERLAQMERTMKKSGVNAASDDDEDKGCLFSPTMQRSQMLGHYSGNSLPPPEIVNHLVDLFFKYINSVIPFIHRVVLKKSIQDGTVSHPLLYSVMALSARFSEHPSIRTDPPYLAGEKFAQRALSLVDSELLEPNLANIQFWGIMSCLEYGRASGSKSWIYAGLAVKFCQELGLYKEETLSLPILADDGSIDTVAMALRRRVFWNCLCIDKLSCAGTHRPQCIDKSDCDANTPNISECITLRDPVFHQNVDGEDIVDDSLMNIAKHYMKALENYGEANRYMNRAKNNSASIVWPPIAEFSNLDRQLRAWQETLPKPFQFNQKNLDHHRKHASSNYLNIWLSGQAIWCSSMMILHRASLAFSDITPADTSVPEDLYRRIQQSINTCRMCVDSAMGIFGAIKDLCGCNTLPYMGYSAYVFATVLMTSTFSSTPELCEKSGRGLKILYELIDGLAPYWPMCERLANATQELLVAHQRIYKEPVEQKSGVQYHVSEVKVAYPSKQSLETRKSSSSTQSSSTNSASHIGNTLNEPAESRQSSLLLGTATIISEEAGVIAPYLQQQPQQQGISYKAENQFMPSPPSAKDSLLNTQPPLIHNQNLQGQQPTTLSSTYSNWNKGSEIDFNSLDFLYNTGLFGQVVFDGKGETTEGATATGGYQPQDGLYQNIINPQASESFMNSSSILMNASASSSIPPMNYSSFAPII